MHELIYIHSKRYISLRKHPLNHIDHGTASHRKKITLHSIRKLYDSNIPIAVMTAHDYPSGSYVERAEMDICLVGDSLAMVTLGYETTNEITLDVISASIIEDLTFEANDASFSGCCARTETPVSGRRHALW